jgi:hypothetical protein
MFSLSHSVRSGREANLMDTDRLLLTVLFVKGDHEWIAECVEYDLVAQGATQEEACRSFERVLRGRLMVDGMKMRRPLEGSQRSPGSWTQRLQLAKPLNGNCELGRSPFRPSNMFEFRTLELPA